tara:strand:- start:953 stop:1213 length:261 start_codon:yes stop_codon:yes gene_type:complete
MSPEEIKKDLLRMKGLKVNPNTPKDLAIAIQTFIQQAVIVGEYDLDTMPSEYVNNLLEAFSKYPQYKDLMDDLINILNRYDAIDRI